MCPSHPASKWQKLDSDPKPAELQSLCSLSLSYADITCTEEKAPHPSWETTVQLLVLISCDIGQVGNKPGFGFLTCTVRGLDKSEFVTPLRHMHEIPLVLYGQGHMKYTIPVAIPWN